MYAAPRAGHWHTLGQVIVEARNLSRIMKERLRYVRCCVFTHEALQMIASDLRLAPEAQWALRDAPTSGKLANRLRFTTTGGRGGHN